MKSKSYTPSSSGSAASKFGQMIGEVFEKVVITFIRDYLADMHQEYEILEPEEGRQVIALEMLGGTLRQLDTVVVAKESDEPVALLETKWLKDKRHHNDKGAWILQLREMYKRYPTVRGAATVLAGNWSEGVGVMFASEGGIKMVWVASDEEVYGTLQKPLDDYLGDDSFALDPEVMRVRYPRAYDLANFLIEINENGELEKLAASWLNFVRGSDADGNDILGRFDPKSD